MLLLLAFPPPPESQSTLLGASREPFYEWLRLSNALLIPANQAGSTLYIISGESLNSLKLFVALKKTQRLIFFSSTSGLDWEFQGVVMAGREAQAGLYQPVSMNKLPVGGGS